MSEKNKRIVLADDDADDRQLFGEALQDVMPGVQLHFCTDGEELMEYLTHTKELPDLIFLDLNMPKKNGKECLIEIRSNHRLSRVPIVIFSTTSDTSDVDFTYGLGARNFLKKPNSFEILKGAISQILSEASKWHATVTREGFVMISDTPPTQ